MARRINPAEKVPQVRIVFEVDLKTGEDIYNAVDKLKATEPKMNLKSYMTRLVKKELYGGQE